MAAGLAIVILFLGAVIGWFARRAYGMHGDMKVNKARVPTFRGNRNKAGLVVIGVLIVAFLLIRAVA
jgi:hypothetical protein